jgi:hypothetical protein
MAGILRDGRAMQRHVEAILAQMLAINTRPRSTQVGGGGHRHLLGACMPSVAVLARSLMW